MLTYPSYNLLEQFRDNVPTVADMFMSKLYLAKSNLHRDVDLIKISASMFQQIIQSYNTRHMTHICRLYKKLLGTGWKAMWISEYTHEIFFNN